MPIYTYKCDSCGREYEKYRLLSKRLVKVSCDCGQLASFILSVKPKTRNLYPYDHEFMDVKPVRIESRKHYLQELSKRNLVETGRRRGSRGQWI